MRIISEELDGTNYLEIILNYKDLKKLDKDGIVYEDEYGIIDDLPINIFIRKNKYAQSDES